MFANVKSDGSQRAIFLPRWQFFLRQTRLIPKGKKTFFRVLCIIMCQAKRDEKCCKGKRVIDVESVDIVQWGPCKFFSASAKNLLIIFASAPGRNIPGFRMCKTMDGPGGRGDCWQAQPEPGSGSWIFALELLSLYVLQVDFSEYLFNLERFYEVKQPP
jgi:hypothetical protein